MTINLNGTTIRRPSLTMTYLPSIDQTLIKKEEKGRIYACHWAGQVSEEEIGQEMKKKEVVFHPYSESQGAYVGKGKRGKRFAA